MNLHFEFCFQKYKSAGPALQVVVTVLFKPNNSKCTVKYEETDFCGILNMNF